MRGRFHRTPPLGLEVHLADSPVQWKSRWGRLPLSDTRVGHPDPNLEQTKNKSVARFRIFTFFHNDL